MKRIDHAEASSTFIKAKDHLEFHDKRLWDLRGKRDRESGAMPEWQALRTLASGIKEHTLTHLADYLEEFERNATSERRQRALGEGRRRAQRDRPRDPALARRAHAGQGEVDADRRVRDAPVSSKTAASR